MICGVHAVPKGLLDALRKRLAAVCLCKEHLRAAILGLLEVILMDADQQAVFHRVHHGSAVFQVGDLFLRDGPAIAGIDRRIRIADHLRIDARKRKQVAQPQRDFQIDPAFQNAVRRRCAAVLTAVSGVENDCHRRLRQEGRRLRGLGRSQKRKRTQKQSSGQQRRCQNALIFSIHRLHLRKAYGPPCNFMMIISQRAALEKERPAFPFGMKCVLAHLFGSP